MRREPFVRPFLIAGEGTDSTFSALAGGVGPTRPAAQSLYRFAAAITFRRRRLARKVDRSRLDASRPRARRIWPYEHIAAYSPQARRLLGTRLPRPCEDRLTGRAGDWPGATTIEGALACIRAVVDAAPTTRASPSRPKRTASPSAPSRALMSARFSASRQERCVGDRSGRPATRHSLVWLYSRSRNPRQAAFNGPPKGDS